MYKRYGLILLALIVLSPIGLVADGTAWGEWDKEEIKSTLGYVPAGLLRLNDWWQAVFPDYTVRIFGDSMLGHSMGYIVSALVGSALIYGLSTFLINYIVRQKEL